MTILDRSSGNRIRIDATQFADELAKRLPDFDKTRDQAANAVHDAAGQARHQIDRATEIARVIRGDLAHSAEKVAADNPIDEIGQRIKAVASTTTVRALISRLEKELPDADRDKYHRAYARGWTQARSKYLVVGIVAGVSAGAVAAILLDPTHGKGRRDALARKTSSLTRRAGRTVAGKAKYASDRVRGVAIERGVIKPPVADPVAPVPVPTDGPVTDPASTQWEPITASDAGAIQPLAAAEADFKHAAGTARPIVADALDLAGDRSTTRSIHG